MVIIRAEEKRKQRQKRKRVKNRYVSFDYLHILTINEEVVINKINTIQ